MTVTVLCPALVRTAMSEIGEDPADVAAAAMTAAEAARFAVVPPEWQTAVVAGAQGLVTGQRPTPPSPE